MSIVRRILGSLEARLSQPRLSLWRTLYVNFRLLPFKEAVKLPLFIYGKVRLFILSGKVQFNSTIYRGMVKIGVNGDSFSLFDNSGYIQLADKNSIIEFDGPCRIALNTKVRVVCGRLKFGENTRIGSNCRIICNGADITIGRYTGVTFDCQIMNSGFHYMYDINEQAYINRSTDIRIGSFNWIGNHSFVSGNTVTPDYTIVAQDSLLNKSYVDVPEYSLLAGIPAKFIKTGIKRVFSPETERKINNLFKNHQKDKIIHCDEIYDDFKAIIQEM